MDGATVGIRPNSRRQATGRPSGRTKRRLRIKLRQALGESAMDVLIVFGDDNFNYVTGAGLPFAPEIPDRRAVPLQRVAAESVIICPLDWAEAIREQGWAGQIDVYDESNASAHDALVRSLVHALETMGLTAAGPAWTWRGFRCRSSRSCDSASRNSNGFRPTATQRAAAGRLGERDRAPRDSSIALQERAGQCPQPHRRHHRRHQLRRMGIYRESESARRRVRHDRACSRLCRAETPASILCRPTACCGRAIWFGWK